MAPSKLSLALIIDLDHWKKLVLPDKSGNERVNVAGFISDI